MFEEIGRFIDHIPMAIVKFIDRVATRLEKTMPLWALIGINVYLIGGITYTTITSIVLSWWLLLGIFPLLLAVPYVIALIRKIKKASNGTYIPK